MEGLEAPAIGLPQRLDVGRAVGGPGERRLAAVVKQKIGDQPGMTPVSVRKRVDPHEAVVKPHRGLSWVLAVFQPESSISASLGELWRNVVGRHPDVLFSPAKAARPAPDLLEHPAMKSDEPSDVQELVAQGLAAKSPPQGLGDVGLLELVEVSPVERGEAKAPELIGIQRRLPDPCAKPPQRIRPQR